MSHATEDGAKDLVHNDDSEDVVDRLGNPIGWNIKLTMIMNSKAKQVCADRESCIDKEVRQDGISAPANEESQQYDKQSERNVCEKNQAGRSLSHPSRLFEIIRVKPLRTRGAS
jgi:hypothetical protein